MSFKIGNRVKFIGDIKDIPQGSLGTITAIHLNSLYEYEVSFDFDDSPMDWFMNEGELALAK